MQFRLLGPVQVLDGGRVVPVPGGRVRALLAVLLLRAGRVVTVEELVDGLWDESPPTHPRAAVQTYVRRLRQVVGDAVQTRPHGYVIDIEPGQLDLADFRRLVGHATGAAGAAGAVDAAERAELLDTALALWRGPALADLHIDSLVRHEAPRLAEERLHALERLMDARLELGQYAEVVARLTALTKEHPLRERFWAQLMLALYRSGRRADALRAYRTIRGLLADQLGIDPGDELQRVHRSMLSADRRASPEASTAWQPQCQLPLESGDFVGRGQLADRLRELLTAPGVVPIVTVSGAPGIGKTALALRVAHRLRPSFPDGQWFVRLGGSTDDPRDPADVLAALLQTSGMDRAAVPDGLDARAAALRSRLADRRVLLFLDDAHSAAQLTPLLPGTAGNAVLVTSRHDLTGLTALHGGHGIGLGLLTAGEARSLLVGTLGRRRVEAEPAAAAELVELCGRLPLALRIAAANLSTGPGMRIADYVTELRTGNRLAKLAVGDDPRTAVKAAFDLSYAALAPRPRRLFRLLGLVPGPDFTAEAAAALLGGGRDDVQRLLNRLVAANLVHPHAVDRYLLHDLLRLYAAEHAEYDPDREPAWRRLCDHYLSATDAATRFEFASTVRLPRPSADTARVHFADGDAARAWLEAERPNLVAAAIRAADVGPPEVSWQLGDALRGYLYVGRGIPDHRSLYERALAASERAGDLLAQAAMRHALGLMYWSMGDLTASLPEDELALRLYRQANHPMGELAMLTNIAIAVECAGQSRRSRDLMRQAIALARERAAPALLATALTNLGAVHTSLGHLDQAVDCATQGLDLDRRHGRPGALVDGLVIRAKAHRLHGRYESALADLTNGLALCREHGLRANECMVHSGLARLHIDTGWLVPALSHVETALRLNDELPDGWSHVHALLAAGALNLLDDPRLSVEYHDRARQLAQRKGYRGLLAEATAGLAEGRRRSGALDGASDAARQALTIARELGHRVTECRALATLAAASNDADSPREAARFAERASRLRHDTGYRPPASLANTH